MFLFDNLNLMIGVLSLTCALLIAQTRPEEQSIVEGCSTLPYDKGYYDEQGSSQTCDGGFKSPWGSTNYQLGPQGWNKEVTTRLSVPKKVLNVFILTEAGNWINKLRVGTSYLWIGSNSTPFTASPAMTKCSNAIYDAGFFKLTAPTTGQDIVFRRVGAATTGADNNVFTLFELRAYQVPNLFIDLQGILTISAPAPSLAKWAATNLITNLSSRTAWNVYRPVIDSVGTIATYDSCYRTDNTKLSSLGHKMELTINLMQSFFQHAVLFVQDFDDAQSRATTGQIRLENVRVYVGDSPDYTKNKECPGGPYMVAGAASSYHRVVYINYTGDVWKFGKEVWCNLQGQYITLVSDMSHKSTQSYFINLCHLSVFGTIYVRTVPVPLTIEVLIMRITTLDVEKISARSDFAIGNTLNIMLRQKAGTELSWVTFTQDALSTKVNFAPGSTVAPGDYTVILESFDLDGGVFSALKTDTITVKVSMSECSQALSHNFNTLAPIVLVKEYLPTVFFPQLLFSGPHNFTGYACGGTYTQSIAINAPVVGVVLTDQPTGADLRPRVEVLDTAPASASFTLTFSGRYVHTPSLTDISTSFTQTYQLKSVVSSDYLDQPTITHTLKAADLTFNVPPAAAGSLPPTHSLAASFFYVAYPIKAGITDSLGNTPPAIVPVPFTGFSASDLSKSMPSLGVATLSSPKGVLNVQGAGSNGNLSEGIVTFTCDAWTLSLEGTTVPKVLTFINSVAAAVSTSLNVFCNYQRQTAPTFATPLPSVVLTASVPSSWTLPPIVGGSFPLKLIRFEPDPSLAGFLIFDETARLVSYDGQASIFNLFGTQLKIKITLLDDQGNQAAYEQTISVCPVTSSDIDALAVALSAEPLSLALSAGKAATTQVVYRSKHDTLVKQLNYSDQKQAQCGAVTFELLTKHSFLMHQPESQSLTLTAEQTTQPAFYEDSFVTVKLSSYSFKIPVRVEFTSCSVTSLSFEPSSLTLEYQVGSGSQQLDLPSLIQKPDCGLRFEQVFIKTIQSEKISAQIVQTAVKLDLLKNVIVVTTYDDLFVGKNVTVVVAVSAVGVGKIADLQIQIQFTANPATELTENNQLKTTSLPTAALQNPSSPNSANTTNATALATDDPDRVLSLNVTKNLGAELGVPGLVVPKVTQEEANILKTPTKELKEEQLFTAVPLAARLTEGVTSLEELILRQREALTSKTASWIAEQKPLPPEVRFESFSNSAKLELRFTVKLNFPRDLENAIREANKPLRLLSPRGAISARNAIQLFAVKGKESWNYNSTQPILKHWELISLRADGITIKVHFFQPLQVSTDEIPDLLIVQLQLSEYKDDNGNSLPQAVVKKFDIPTQFASEDEAFTIYTTGESIEATSSSAVVANFLVNILLAGSLMPVWSLINGLQHVQMSRLSSVITPGNVDSFTTFFQKIASVELFQDLTQLIVDEMLLLPEQDPFSARFMNAGINSKFFVVNAQQQLFLLAVFIAFGLFVAFLWPCAKCCQKVEKLRQILIKKLFWNSYIRLVMESFADVLIFAVMNLYAKDWPKGFSSVTVDIVATCVVLATYALLPSVLFLIIWKKYHRHVVQKPTFEERVGSFLAGTSHAKLAKPSVLLYTLVFFARRLAMALTLIMWHNFFWGQIAVQFGVVTFGIILLQLGQPMETSFANNRETFNEYFNLHILYLLMTFTPFVPEPETRHSLGFVYIIEVCLFVAIHLTFITWSAGSNLRMSLRRCCARRRARAIIRARQAKAQPKDPSSEVIDGKEQVSGGQGALDNQLIEESLDEKGSRPHRRPRINDIVEEQLKARTEHRAPQQQSADEPSGENLPSADQAVALQEKRYKQLFNHALTANEIEWLQPGPAKELPERGDDCQPDKKFNKRPSDSVVQWAVDVENEFWPGQNDIKTTSLVKKERSTAVRQEPVEMVNASAAASKRHNQQLQTQSQPKPRDSSKLKMKARQRLPEFPMLVLPKKAAATDKEADFTLE